MAEDELPKQNDAGADGADDINDEVGLLRSSRPMHREGRTLPGLIGRRFWKAAGRNTNRPEHNRKRLQR